METQGAIILALLGGAVGIHLGILFNQSQKAMSKTKLPEVTEERLQKAYSNADASTKKLLEELYGNDAFKQQHDVLFENACAALGISTDIPAEESTTPRKVAGYKLDVIIEHHNGKQFKANLVDTTQRKYFPFFDIIPDDTVPRGFRLSLYDVSYVRAYASLGVRHACKDDDTARFVGNNCAELYADYHASIR